MTEKLFHHNLLYDEKTGIYCNSKNLTLFECCELLNKITEENKLLKAKLEYHERHHKKWKSECLANINENEQLKQTIKYVAELLSEEVDLFSDKAIEHDVNAYMELKELDNKDAYYIAKATKTAIKMLKCDVE